MDIMMRASDFVILKGVSKKGNVYRLIKLGKELTFSDSFIDEMIKKGVKECEIRKSYDNDSQEVIGFVEQNKKKGSLSKV